MKNTIYIIASLLLLTQCDFVNESKKIEKITNEVSKGNSCIITYENELSDRHKELTLKIHDSLSDVMLSGKIILDMYSALQKGKIKHDNYRVIDDSGNEYLNLKASEIETVLEKKKIFEKDVDLLLTRTDYHGFYNQLNPEMRKFYSYKDLTGKLSELLIKEYPKFNGFSFSDFEGNKYIIFCKSNGKRNIMLSYRFSDASNLIYGFGVE